MSEQRSQEQVSLTRLYLLRGAYFVNAGFLGSRVWPELVAGERAWDSMSGVAFSFWGALSALSVLGLRYPVGMVPLLVLQLSYKLVYLVAIGLPLEFTPGHRVSVVLVFVGGAVMDLVAIPWRYTASRFVRAPGDRWAPASDEHAPAAVRSAKATARADVMSAR